MWFQTGTRAHHDIDTFLAAPESALNPAFDYILKPGFSLLQKEIVQADERPGIIAALQYSDQMNGSKGQTVGSKV